MDLAAAVVAEVAASAVEEEFELVEVAVVCALVEVVRRYAPAPHPYAPALQQFAPAQRRV